jgi:hypothetical protein
MTGGFSAVSKIFWSVDVYSGGRNDTKTKDGVEISKGHVLTALLKGVVALFLMVGSSN